MKNRFMPFKKTSKDQIKYRKSIVKSAFRQYLADDI